MPPSRVFWHPEAWEARVVATSVMAQRWMTTGYDGSLTVGGPEPQPTWSHTMQPPTVCVQVSPSSSEKDRLAQLNGGIARSSMKTRSVYGSTYMNGSAVYGCQFAAPAGSGLENCRVNE